MEDEPLAAEALERLLGRAGYRVTVATNGVEALEAVRSAPIDGLITDHRMPAMTGGVLVQRIRAMHPRIPVIVVTGYAAEAQDALRAVPGQILILDKPVDPEELRELLGTLLRPAAAG
ncbi:MAG TPA: response regulator [Azospirillaceae bacterium]|nr:response regulator [Azospirillaceae bacterium]